MVCPGCHRVPTPNPRARLRARLGGVWPRWAPARLGPCPVGARLDTRCGHDVNDPLVPVPSPSLARARPRVPAVARGPLRLLGVCVSVSVGREPPGPPPPDLLSPLRRLCRAPSLGCVRVSRRGLTRSRPRTPLIPPALSSGLLPRGGLRPRRRGARPAPVPGFSLACASERASERAAVPAGPTLLTARSYLVDPASSICLSQRLSHACLSTHGRYSETANGSLNQLWFLWSLAPLLLG